MSLRCGEIRASILLWNVYLKMWNDSQICLKKMSRKVQREYSGVSVFLPRSPWGLISDHTENGESLPHNGEQVLILCQNIFKIWTLPSFLWRAAPSMGLVTGGISAHSPPIHEAPFISLSDMLSVMVQRGSILIVWTDHSRERSFDLGCWQNRHRLAESLWCVPLKFYHCIVLIITDR